jgi:hypothetical protein
MSTRFRSVLSVAVVATALVCSAGVSAGVIDKAAEKLHDKKSDSQSDNQSDSKRSGSNETRGSGGQRSAPPPATSSGSDRSRTSGRDARSGDHDRVRTDHDRNGRDSGPTIGLNEDLGRINGNKRSDERSRDYGRDRGDRGSYDRHPPRVIERLPPGYRNYYWNGNRYYSYGGRWYRPYGSTYISIGIPFGLFVTTLPGYYTSFWFGGTRYFYSDHTYYVYEPERRGYVVTRSPYGDDEDEDNKLGDDLFVYPAHGQSEQQQADDRYECHRWAVDQAHYDPLDDDYDAGQRADYQRAMTACLTGRGYTVN